MLNFSLQTLKIVLLLFCKNEQQSFLRKKSAVPEPRDGARSARSASFKTQLMIKELINLRNQEVSIYEH